jgi:predicted DNA-binding transcriptional regulator YafY
MNRAERFYRIEVLIRSRGGASFEALRDELDVSPATLKRDLQYLRDRMDAPIVYHRLDNLYRFSEGGASPARELPGLWFSESEIHALLSMHRLIEGLDAGGVLSRHLQPMLDKLHHMLNAGSPSAAPGAAPGPAAGDSRELMRRVRIAHPARRRVPERWFEAVGSALLGRKRLELRYFSRARQSESVREVSPQRLVHHRNTWYLDAWCHRSEALRRFALDAVRAAKVLDTLAIEIALTEVESALDGGYGIFSGEALEWATLVFTAEAAQWVAQEEWHPRQQTLARADGRLEVRLPYADPTELVMDILRHGAQVKVEAPESLVALVAQRLREAAAQYASPSDAGDAP